MSAQLIFPAAGQPQGFSTLATTHWDGNPEPIIREILQNCLDAGVQAGRDRSEVTFSIRSVAKNDIPGMFGYQEHFVSAVAQRQRGKQGAAEKRVIKQIQRVLNSDRVRILFCRDNGVGLDPDRMHRLLTEGNTDKETGAGAFGVGHLTAFAASDTRYILYAGRSHSNTESDPIDVASAHAILASRRQGNHGLGGHGYWLKSRDLTLFDSHPYPDIVPQLMKDELSQLADTGSVVAITGFNDFRNTGRHSSVDDIARVAAKNFLVAIWRNKMTIRICEHQEGGHPAKDAIVSHNELGAILNAHRTAKRAEQGGGWLSGEQAYRAWQVLTMGDAHILDAGVEVRIRLLEKDEGAASRVQIFRDGMWITNQAPRLGPRFFTGYNPFDAVVMISQGKLARLVRDAEGPEHRGLDRRRLGHRDRQQLDSLLAGIQRDLQQLVGKVERSKEFQPADFALITGDVVRRAEKAPRYRPRKSKGEDDVMSTPKAVENGNDQLNSKKKKKRRRSRRKSKATKPQPGRGVAGQSSVLALPNDDGLIGKLKVWWRPSPSARRVPGELAIRVRIASGSDETCDAPVPPSWVKLKELRHRTGSTRPAGDDFEANLPRGQRDAMNLEILLAEPIRDPHALELDVVRRKT